MSCEINTKKNFDVLVHCFNPIDTRIFSSTSIGSGASSSPSTIDMFFSILIQEEDGEDNNLNNNAKRSNSNMNANKENEEIILFPSSLFNQ